MIFEWAGGKLKEIFMDTLEEAISGWIEDFINWILAMIIKIVFNLPQSTFVDNTMNFLAWFTGIFAVVVALYKVVEYIINTSTGTQQYPLDEIILRVIKSAAAMLVLPWVIKILMLDIALPLANYFAMAATDFGDKEPYDLIASKLLESPLSVAGFGGGIGIIIMLIFFSIVFFMFLYSVCIFYADYVIMQILIAPVSLSMIADDNNYFQVWWRELLSMIVSLLIKIFLVTLVLNTLFTGGNIFLAIGAGALIIKTPSVLKNMWYGGGGARAISRGAGNIGSMGSRLLLTRLLN